MKITSSYATDVGQKRKLNEDSYYVNDKAGIYAVCDGMGGHSCGDVASQTAVQVMGTKVDAALKKGTATKEPQKTLTEAIALANTAVFEIGSKLGPGRSMGTTVAGVAVGNGKIYTAHVGDSRVYRIRGNNITQLTTDHSLVEEQVALGLLTKEQARTSNKKNIITRALGLKNDVKIDTKEYDAAPGDFILVCSDGLSGLIEDKDLLALVAKEKSGNLDNIVMSLVETANKNGGDDNITVVVLNFKA